MSQPDRKRLLRAFYEAVREFVRRENTTLAERVELLEKQIEVIQKAGYRGTWKAGHSYESGMYVTDKGALWACLEPTVQRPGNSPAWRLAVKSGEASSVTRL